MSTSPIQYTRHVGMSRECLWQLTIAVTMAQLVAGAPFDLVLDEAELSRMAALAVDAAEAVARSHGPDFFAVPRESL